MQNITNIMSTQYHQSQIDSMSGNRALRWGALGAEDQFYNVSGAIVELLCRKGVEQKENLVEQRSSGA